jgi:hypothetical protein
MVPHGDEFNTDPVVSADKTSAQQTDTLGNHAIESSDMCESAAIVTRQ